MQLRRDFLKQTGFPAVASTLVTYQLPTLEEELSKLESDTFFSQMGEVQARWRLCHTSNAESLEHNQYGLNFNESLQTLLIPIYKTIRKNTFLTLEHRYKIVPSNNFGSFSSSDHTYYSIVPNNVGINSLEYRLLSKERWGWLKQWFGDTQRYYLAHCRDWCNADVFQHKAVFVYNVSIDASFPPLEDEFAYELLVTLCQPNNPYAQKGT